MTSLLSFDEALRSATAKKHLLIGNGFSVALFPRIFSYARLLDTADFGDHQHLKDVFSGLNTTDFEHVIRSLSSAAIVARTYGGDIDAMIADTQFLKELLVSTIASSHPSLPSEVSDDQCRSARIFLHNFQHKYTLNYDLLLYWAQMRTDVDDFGLDAADDGFRDPGQNEDYVVWDDFNSPTTHYLHGALHLFDDGDQLQKYTWSRTSTPLMDQIRASLERDAFPLFVSEGNSQSKMERINHSGYLHKAFRSFRSCTGSLFVFGHSFSGDEHIFSELSSHRSKYDMLFVSIYGDPESAENKKIISSAIDISEKRDSRRKLEVMFFDSESAHVWG